jgi:hypothetical protein
VVVKGRRGGVLRQKNVAQLAGELGPGVNFIETVVVACNLLSASGQNGCELGLCVSWMYSKTYRRTFYVFGIATLYFIRIS